MKELILKYLDKNYKFTLSTYVSYNLYDKIDNKEARLVDVLDSLKLIFTIDNDKTDLLMDIFDIWADKKAIEIQNNITDLRYKLYEKTGIELQLTPADLNNMLRDKENEAMFGPNHWWSKDEEGTIN